MANAVEASANTARPRKLKKGAAQGETAAARRDGVQQGNCQRTKKGEFSRLPKNEHLTGTVTSHSTNHTVSGHRHGRGDTGRGAQGEDGRAKDPATMDASRTAKLTVGLRSTRGEEEKENVKREKVTIDPSAIRKDGTDEGSQIVERRRPWFSSWRCSLGGEPMLRG